MQEVKRRCSGEARRWLPTVTLVLAVFVAGCSGGDSADSRSTPPSDPDSLPSWVLEEYEEVGCAGLQPAPTRLELCIDHTLDPDAQAAVVDDITARTGLPVQATPGNPTPAVGR